VDLVRFIYPGPPPAADSELARSWEGAATDALWDSDFQGDPASGVQPYSGNFAIRVETFGPGGKLTLSSEQPFTGPDFPEGFDALQFFIRGPQAKCISVNLQPFAGADRAGARADADAGAGAGAGADADAGAGAGADAGADSDADAAELGELCAEKWRFEAEGGVGSEYPIDLSGVDCSEFRLRPRPKEPAGDPDLAEVDLTLGRPGSEMKQGGDRDCSVNTWSPVTVDLGRLPAVPWGSIEFVDNGSSGDGGVTFYLDDINLVTFKDVAAPPPPLRRPPPPPTFIPTPTPGGGGGGGFPPSGGGGGGGGGGFPPSGGGGGFSPQTRGPAPGALCVKIHERLMGLVASATGATAGAFRATQGALVDRARVLAAASATPLPFGCGAPLSGYWWRWWCLSYCSVQDVYEVVYPVLGQVRPLLATDTCIPGT